MTPHKAAKNYNSRECRVVRQLFKIIAPAGCTVR
jgi:hypothetical protein